MNAYAFPYPQATTLTTHGSELARRELLERFERNRRAADRGRLERVRYGSMTCKVIGVADVDRLHVETTFADWDGAARPSRGQFGSVATVTIFDVHPAMIQVRGDFGPEWRVDSTAVVRLLVGWPDATRVDLVAPVEWGCRLKAGSVIVTDRAPGRPTALEGQIQLRLSGQVVDATIAPYRRPRPATPVCDLAPDAKYALAWERPGLTGYARIAAAARVRDELAARELAERERLADWEAHERAPRTEYSLDRDVLAGRWRDGLQLTDTL